MLLFDCIPSYSFFTGGTTALMPYGDTSADQPPLTTEPPFPTQPPLTYKGGEGEGEWEF